MYNNVQEAFAEKIKDAQANVFKEKDGFFNKYWLDVTNNRELYFWTKFVLNSVCSFWSKYQGKDKKDNIK